MKHLVAFALCYLLMACGGKQEKGPSLESRNFAVERDTFFNSLRQHPDEIAENLIPGLSGFDGRVLNDASLFYQYANNDVKAASNLGIYLADLNYCILYKEAEAVKKYFEAVRELSIALRIEKSTLDFLSKRYADNIARHDSMKVVMHELLANSTVGLQGTDRERLAGIAMAAYQIENLHLVLATLQTLPENLNEAQGKSKHLLLQYVLAQQGKFEITYNFIKSFSDPLDPSQNPNYPFFDNALRELITAYRQLVDGQSKDLKDSTIELKGSSALSDLSEKVNVIRAKIISRE